jgi:hypothetical protein
MPDQNIFYFEQVNDSIDEVINLLATWVIPNSSLS